MLIPRLWCHFCGRSLGIRIALPQTTKAGERKLGNAKGDFHIKGTVKYARHIFPRGAV